MKNVILSVFAVVLLGMYSGSINAQSSQRFNGDEPLQGQKDSLAVYTLITTKDLGTLKQFMTYLYSIVPLYKEGIYEASAYVTAGGALILKPTIIYYNETACYVYYVKYKYKYKDNGGQLIEHIESYLRYMGIQYGHTYRTETYVH